MAEMPLAEEAAHVLALYRARGWRIATAESCTGGLVAGTLTAVAGSSDVVDRGFVTYSNAAKTDMVGVPAETIAAHGAVSAEVAGAMASGALAHSLADVAVSCTGIAGPGGATPGKPVGLVYLGLARRDASGGIARHVFPGDRTAVREATVRIALNLLREAAED